MSENRCEVVDAWFASAWLGAILVPINTAMRGPQLEHVLTNSGPRALAIEPALVQHLDVLETVPPELELIWLLGGEGGRGWHGRPVAPFPELRRPRSRPCGSTRRHRGDPVHLRDNRPLEGRDVPAGPVLLVGAWHGRHARRPRRGRRALHVPAALPHQRPQCVHPSTDPRRDDRSRSTLLGLALLVAAHRGGRDRDLPARRDGLDPRQAASVARRPRAPGARCTRSGDAG